MISQYNLSQYNQRRIFYNDDSLCYLQFTTNNQLIPRVLYLDIDGVICPLISGHRVNKIYHKSSEDILRRLRKNY